MKKFYSFGAVAAMSLMLLTGCGSDNSATDNKTEASEKATQTITYLGEKYEITSNVKTIIAASLESMEDAAVLGVKPAGVISTSGNEVPSYLKSEMDGATVIGSKRDPDAEAMLKLSPDVILGTDKFDEAQMKKFNKVAVTFPYTYLADKWQDNLKLMGQLTNKTEEAQTIISTYKKDAENVKMELAKKYKNATAVVIRVRGSMKTYGPNLYMSPQLYNDFGFEMPDELKNQKMETELSQETLAKIDPDFIFIQFAEDENPETPDALKEIMNNKIFKKLTASQENHVYKNVINPLAQGGTAWSKLKFLEAVETQIIK